MNDSTQKSVKKTATLEAFLKTRPAIRCRLDNAHELFDEKSGRSVFSWQVKGNFTLPLVPLAVGAIATAITLSCLFSTKD